MLEPRIMLLLLLTGCLTSCAIYEKPVSTVPAKNNQEYHVDYLFEHDGCKVYRFHDRGNWVYFTNCEGQTMVRADSATVIQNQTHKK